MVAAWINELIGHRDYPEWSQGELGYLAPHDGDDDGDQPRNYDEYLLDLDPLDYSERWGIGTIAAGPGGAPVISFERLANRTIYLESTATPQNPLSWEFLDVPGNEWSVPSISSPAAITDPRPNQERMFYRLRFTKP